jgi:hypothetical protein
VIRRSICFAFVLVIGCPAPGAPTRTEERVIHPTATPIAPFEECTVYTATERAVSRSHREVCSDLTYASMPPAGGDHYGTWADFGTYDAPIPWPFLVHSLEHGAVVLAYRCDPGPECDALEAELQTVIDDFGADDLCRSGGDLNRFILVPDPTLEWAFAAVAWEHLYLATCFDRASLDEFVAANYAHAPENLCAAGADRSATGWCP